MREGLVYVFAVLGVVVVVGSIRRLRAEAAATVLSRVGVTVTIATGGVLYEGGILPQGAATQLALAALTIGAALSFLVRGSRARLPLIPLAMVPAAISFVMFASNALNNPTADAGTLFGRLLPVVTWIALGLAYGTGRAAIESLRLALSLTLGIVAVLMPFGQVWRDCDRFKCGPFDAILTGGFPSENLLAQVTCVALILNVVGFQKHRTLPVVLGALVLYGTESRTSQLALVASLAACLVLYLFGPAVRRVGLVVLVAAGSAVGFYLLTHSEPTRFSNRGLIWQRGMEALGSSQATGLGLERWYLLQTIGVLPPLFPHSQILLLLFGGGVLAVAGYLLFQTWSVLRTVDTVDFPVAVASLTFGLVNGLTEVAWNPAGIDGHSFVILPLLIAGLARSLGDGERELAALSSDKHRLRLARPAARGRMRSSAQRGRVGAPGLGHTRDLHR